MAGSAKISTDGSAPKRRAEREFVVGSQRERLLDAMANTCAQKGYAATSVADVVAGARVSRATFYEFFRDKEECFLAAYDAILAQFLGRVIGAYQQEGQWPERIRWGLEAILAFMAAEPAFARMCLIEVLAAGPAALERRTLIMDRFIAQLAALGAAARAAAPELPELAPHVYEASVGASNELVARQLLRGGPESLPELAVALVDIQLKLLGP